MIKNFFAWLGFDVTLIRLMTSSSSSNSEELAAYITKQNLSLNPIYTIKPFRLGRQKLER
jgi:hypothetical protein